MWEAARYDFHETSSKRNHTSNALKLITKTVLEITRRTEIKIEMILIEKSLRDIARKGFNRGWKGFIEMQEFFDKKNYPELKKEISKDNCAPEDRERCDFSEQRFESAFIELLGLYEAHLQMERETKKTGYFCVSAEFGVESTAHMEGWKAAKEWTGWVPKEKGDLDEGKSQMKLLDRIK